MLRSTLALGSLVLLAACSSSSDPTTPSSGNAAADDGVSGDIREAVTWDDGTKLSGVVRIVEGATVTIAPGAKITCSEAVQIVIGGTLKVDSKATHATITCAKWAGIIVGKNGSLDIDGLDIENPSTGYETTNGAGSCVVKDSKIASSIRPIKVGAGSKLTLDHVDAATPTTIGIYDSSVAEIFGSLEAHYLHYQANTNEGIMLKDGADAVITDSILEGVNGQDMVSSYEGKSLAVSYTTLTGGHCGPHLQGVGTATFDHVTSTGNQFGITIYKGDNVTVTNSNFSGSQAWLDLQGDHGPVTMTNNFLVNTAGGTAPAAVVTNTDPPVSNTMATAQIVDAVPRPDTQ